MKTSLDIDDQLYQAARLHAAREHTTLRALVERGLAEVLGLAPNADVGEFDPTELEQLRALCAQVSSLPLLTEESAECILGYDEIGGFE